MKKALKSFAVMALLWAAAAFGQVFTTLYLPSVRENPSASLYISVAAGRVFCGTSMVNYAGGTLLMSASTTNYVYLNTASSCALAVKTSTFVLGDIPIAVVVAGSSTITSVGDRRTPFSWPSGSSTVCTASPAPGTNTIQTAITGLPSTGGILCLSAGTYTINHSGLIVMGNGTTTSWSTVNGIVLLGSAPPTGPFQNYQGGFSAPTPGSTIIDCSGISAGDACITVKGPMEGWGLQNLFISGPQPTSGSFMTPPTAVAVISSSYGDSHDVSIVGFNQGWRSDTLTSCTGSCRGNWGSLLNQHRNIKISLANNANAVGVILTGSAGSAAANTDFNNWVGTEVAPFGSGTLGYGVVLGAGDNNNFFNLHMLGGLAHPLVYQYDNGSSTAWPDSTNIIAYEASSEAITETGTPNGNQNYISNSSKANGGVCQTGLGFVMNNCNQSGKPQGVSITGLGGVTVTNTNGAYSISYTPPVLPNLIASYNLCGDVSCTATSSTTVPDSSGNGNNGTWQGTPSGSIAGTYYSPASNAFPNAGQFTSPSVYVSLGNDSLLNFERTNSFLVCGSMKAASGSANATIASKINGGSPYNGWSFDYIGVSAQLNFQLTNTHGSNAIIVTGTGVVNDGITHFVCVAYDGSSTAAGVKFFIDGASDATSVVGEDDLSATTQTAYDALLGAQNGPGGVMTGTLNVAKFYSPEPASIATVVGNLYAAQR